MGGTILLADDSLTIQKVVELTFAETDHVVVAVGGGRELLERVPTVKPDVILCDVVMPDMTGYEVCQLLKSDPARLHIPVVLLTGTFEPFDRDRAMASGCDAVITKPFEARELIDTVDQLMARAKALAPPDDEPGVEGIGVPEGVPALDFTTTGFDKMVAPPSAPLAPPEEGIELTASVSPAGAAAAAGAQAPEDAGGDVGEKTAPPFAFEPAPPTLEPRVEEGPGGAAAAPAPLEEAPADAAAADVLAQAASPSAAAAVPSADGAAEEVTSQARVAAAVAVEPPAGAMTVELSEEQIERIARRVVELAGPQIERIAWEVIPDLAEMIVRQRIQELEAAAEQEN